MCMTTASTAFKPTPIALGERPVRTPATPDTSTDWIDVSVPVEEGKVPVYPGNPGVHFEFAQSPDKGDCCRVSDLHFGAHTGTHVDAPSHFIPDGATIDQVPLSKLMGPCMVIDCGPDAKVIDAAELNRHDWRGAERVLFKTANSYRGLMHNPIFQEDFTALAPDAARLLADNGVQLVGIDYNSMEPFRAKEPDTHRALLGQGIPILEGVDLQHVSEGQYQIVCLPVSLVGREAAPARVLLQPQ